MHMIQMSRLYSPQMSPTLRSSRRHTFQRGALGAHCVESGHHADNATTPTPLLLLSSIAPPIHCGWLLTSVFYFSSMNGCLRRLSTQGTDAMYNFVLKLNLATTEGKARFMKKWAIGRIANGETVSPREGWKFLQSLGIGVQKVIDCCP